MEIPSAFSSGVQGINSALQSAENSAREIAEATVFSADQSTGNSTTSDTSQLQSPSPTSTSSVTNGAIGLLEAQTNTAANAQVVQTADEVLGTIVDIKV